MRVFGAALLDLGNIDGGCCGFGRHDAKLLNSGGFWLLDARIFCAATDADRGVSGHGYERNFVRLPVGDAVDFLVFLRFDEGGFVDRVAYGDVFADAVSHVLENLLGPRASSEANDGAANTVGVDAD